MRTLWVASAVTITMASITARVLRTAGYDEGVLAKDRQQRRRGAEGEGLRLASSGDPHAQALVESIQAGEVETFNGLLRERPGFGVGVDRG